jgi:hypothetical protein
MKLMLSGGTELGEIVLFGPEALTPEDRTRVRLHDSQFMQSAEKEGRFLVSPCREGGQMLHAYIDEELPQAILPFLEKPKDLELLHLKAGNLTFGGVESVYASPELRESGRVPAGDYRVTLWSMRYPKGQDIETLLPRERLTPRERLIVALPGLIILVSVISTILAAALLSGQHRSAKWSVAVFIIGVLVFIGVGRTAAYRQAASRARDLERQYPSHVAQLKRVAA